MNSKYKYLIDETKETKETLSIEDIFLISCYEDKKSLAEQLWNISILNKNWRINNIKKVFTYACKNGNLNIVEWLYNLGTEILIDDKSFMYACENGHQEIAEWLYKTSSENGNKININAESECAFRQACRNGHFNIVKWLYNLSMTDSNSKININVVSDFAFRYASCNGHLQIARWLYNLSKTNDKIDIHAMNEDAFRFACCYGHRNTAEWLYDLSRNDNNTKIDIHASHDDAFRHACRNDDKNIAEWLYNLSKVDDNGKINIDLIANDKGYTYSQTMKEWLDHICQINKKDDENATIIAAFDKTDFIMACANGYGIKAERIYLKTKINAYVDEAFEAACFNDQKYIAKWLYDLQTIDNSIKINANIDIIFQKACIGNRINIVKWLSTLNNNYLCIFENNKIVPYKRLDLNYNL